MHDYKIGTREEWKAARDELAKLEAEHTKLGQKVTTQRRKLPWVPVEKEYQFDTEDGKKTLGELFDGRSQLLAYNIMFGPDYELGACPGCSSLGDELDATRVIRNIGGRITPATLQTMAMLRLVAGENAGGPGWNLIVLHHTDCGINHLTGYPDLLAEHFGIGADELDSKHITDPRRSVATDVALLKSNPFLPGEFVVSGLVYDVSTGLIEQVAGPELLRSDPDTA
jgi:carbonic anhydrase